MAEFQMVKLVEMELKEFEEFVGGVEVAPGYLVEEAVPGIEGVDLVFVDLEVVQVFRETEAREFRMD